jgi:hypothetical protein
VRAEEAAARWVEVGELREWDANPRQEQPVEEVAESIRRFGFGAPILARMNGEIIAGHTRWKAAKSLGLGRVPVRYMDLSEAEARALALADNRLGELAEWDVAGLAEALREIRGESPSLDGLGWESSDLDLLFDLYPSPGDAIGSEEALSGPVEAEVDPQIEEQRESLSLAARFVVPPFSILDARRGYWQDRKREWIALGIVSELGRGEEGRPSAIPGGSRLPAAQRSKDGSTVRGDSRGREALRREEDSVEGRRSPEWAQQEGEYTSSGTSIFDPVLCEIALRWFAPRGGSVLDPFAGGSVRGVVASVLGHSYTGVELRGEQVEANREQGAKIVPDRPPRWICGDSRNLDDLLDAEERFDLVFSCPPYADLEVYSDDPEDLSVIAAAEGYPAFREAYFEILRRSFARLRENRFAVFVVGDVRGKDGRYLGFVQDTIRAGLEAGLVLYNHAILVTSVASLPLRISGLFGRWRKLGKTHQDVVVLYKGDPRAIPEAFGEIDFAINPREALASLDAEGSQESPEEAETVRERVEAREEVSDVSSTPESPESDASPPWARGYDLDDLRAIRALFREHDGDLTLGAFSAAKENQIATWLAKGRLEVFYDGPENPIGAVLASVSNRKRKLSDFSGRPLGTVGAGVPLVERVAWREGNGLDEVAREIRRLSQDGEIWWRLWQEKDEERALAERLGFAWTGSQIRASSEVLGLWRRTRAKAFAIGEDLPSHDRAHLSALDLPPMPEECEALRLAVEKRVDGWAEHYSSYNRRKSWTALALASFGGDPAFIVKPSEMSKRWKKENPEALEWTVSDTALRELLPEAEPLIEAIPGKKERIRLMRLSAEVGELSRHSDITDPDCGTGEGKILRIHWPIETSPEVLFDGWLDDGSRILRHMEQGRAWYLDTRKPHRAINRGSRDRIHLVLDVYSSPELLALLRVDE